MPVTLKSQDLESQAGKPYILLVEDETTVREHLAEVLADRYRVETAGSGTEALRAVTREKPDLIVTDIVMPEMDGVEFLRTLRSVPSTQGIPVLLISGHAPEARRIEGFQEGADAYLAKPYSESELRARLGSMIQSARERREAARREALEEAARQAMAERSVLLDSITDAFYALDGGWRFTYLNRRALEHFGRTREELLGQVIWEAFEQARGTTLQAQFEQALTKQCPLAFELLSPITGHWNDIRVYPTGLGLAVHFRDISQRKRAEEELNAALAILREREWRLALATSVAGLGVFTFDLKADEITFENEQAREILGVPMGCSLSGSDFLSGLLHHDDRAQLIQGFSRSRRKAETVHASCRIRGASGAWRWVEIDGGFIQDTADCLPHRVVGVIQDVTHRRAREEALRESDRRKDEFLALLAHELRNPLAPIGNGISILKAGAPSHPLISQTVPIMDRQLNHLVRLVDDLLDVSRITHGRVQLHARPIYLRDVLSRAIEAAQGLIDAHSHELRIDNRASEVVVDGDPDRLQQVFSNLVINAAKYTAPGGRILISIERKDGEAVVAVTDSGMGIAHEALEHVFDMFGKGSKQRPGDGLGIGLTLVRLLVGLHGGSVFAASPGAGEGSTFTVHLPVSEATPRMARGKPRETARESALRARRVLVVDDNGDAAASLALLLELKGYRVATAADGEGAVERAREFRPGLIFMDLGLPGIDGVEAAKRIHAERDLKSVPIVALTGWGKPEDRKRTAAAGMVAHLVKPVAPEELDEALRFLEADESEGTRYHVHH